MSRLFFLGQSENDGSCRKSWFFPKKTALLLQEKTFAIRPIWEIHKLENFKNLLFAMNMQPEKSRQEKQKRPVKRIVRNTGPLAEAPMSVKINPKTESARGVESSDKTAMHPQNKDVQTWAEQSLAEAALPKLEYFLDEKRTAGQTAHAEKRTGFVKIPVAEYERMVEIIEQYGLYLAMKEVENQPRLTRETALSLLESDEN